jgi:hypothetical protein
MSKTEKQTENATQGQSYWEECTKCKHETKHTVLNSIDTWDSSDDGEIEEQRHFQTISCNGCGDLGFRRESSCSEDDEDQAPRVELFPPRNRPFSRNEYDFYFPRPVRTLYAEVHAALANGLRILAGSGIRSIVETVCESEHATGRRLQSRIDSLVMRQKLTAEGAEILHRVRGMGNRVVHKGNVPDDEDLSAAMHVIENLLQNLYIVQKIAQRLDPPG